MQTHTQVQADVPRFLVTSAQLEDPGSLTEAPGNGWEAVQGMRGASLGAEPRLQGRLVGHGASPKSPTGSHGGWGCPCGRPPQAGCGVAQTVSAGFHAGRSLCLQLVAPPPRTQMVCYTDPGDSDNDSPPGYRHPPTSEGPQTFSSPAQLPLTVPGA